MNILSYKLVFSKRTGTLVAVGEHAAGQGKAASGERATGSRSNTLQLAAIGSGCGRIALAVLPAALAAAMAFSGNSMAQVTASTLPSGGQVGYGNASISSSAGNMQIKQTSNSASINWTAFSIGKDASVNINQPGSSAILLNRVTGSDASQIMGRLSANGQTRCGCRRRFAGSCPVCNHRLYLRFRLRTDSSKHWFDNYSSEISLTAGNLDLSGDINDQAFDAQTFQRAGDYQKLELNGQVASTIDAQRSITASLRWRAQLASKNLSSQNRISMGGVNGIRAYNTADGAGDEGAGLSLDLTKRISDEFYFGALYDYGWVRLAKTPLPTTTVNTYNLQGAGLQFGGAANRFNWNVSVAKSFGDGQDTKQDNNLTQVGDWRINLEVTRAF